MRSSDILARIWVLMATVFVDMLGFLVVLPLLPFYAERLGADPFLVGVLIGSFAFAQLASAPLWGRLSDRYGRRPALLCGLLASAVAYILFGLAESLPVLLLSRLVQGAGGGTTGVAQAYISDAVGPEARTRALGWLSAATSAGVMLGPVLGSVAAGLGQRAPGFLAAGLCLLSFAFAARWLPESARTRAAESDASRRRISIRESLLAVVRAPAAPASVLIWIYSIGMMAFMAMNGVLALFLERRFAFDEGSIGYFYLYVGSISLIMRGAVLGPALRLFGELGALRLGALSLACGLAMLPVPTSLAGLALCAAMVPVGTALLFPATTSLVSRLAPAGQVGQTLGVQQSFGGICRLAGPIWAGAAFQHLSIEAPFRLASGLVLAGAALALGGLRAGRLEAGEATGPPRG